MTKSNAIDVLLTWPRDGIRLFESMIPLGTGIMATFLRDNGYRVKIIDFNHYWRDFEEELERLQPKVVLVGGTTNTRMRSFKTLKTVKKILPEAITVFGGHHATYTAEDSLKHIAEIDYIITGEGEFSALKLCDILIKGQEGDLHSIPGLAYRDGHRVIENPQERIENLSTLPIADRSLYEHRYPMTLDFFNLPADYILTSRGCASSCEFCSAVRMYPGGVRLLPMELIEEEIKQITADGTIKALKIFDSTFTAVRSHVVAFCEMIKPYNLIWECEVRVDTVDFELLSLMKDAGCVYINFGIESVNDIRREAINKGIELPQVESLIEWCQQLDIKTKAFFTFGHLGETYQECLETMDYMKQLKGKIDFFATTVGMRVYPGTPLEKKVQGAGLFPRNFSWATYNPGIRNWPLLEPTNIFILSQKGLPLWRLSQILFTLMKQDTILSPEYIRKMVWENLRVGSILLRMGFLKLWFALKKSIKR